MDLKLCPFCGDIMDMEVAESNCINIHTGDNKYAVYCNSCFCEGPPSLTKEGAIENWNLRAAAKESQTLPATTPMPKLPTEEDLWNHVFNVIEFNDDYARVEEAKSVVKQCHIFISRQLSA
jgi:hypothetical protein